MSERIWDKFLTERDKAVFAAGGFGARAGFGKRPALLVIDVSWAFCGERPEPILESIKRWRNSCGEEGWVALECIKSLTEAALTGARIRLRPIIMTSFAFVLGCVPLWIASGSGGVSRQTMGTTVIGGMLTATLLGIFVIPVAFVVVEKASHLFGKTVPATPATQKSNHESDH